MTIAIPAAVSVAVTLSKMTSVMRAITPITESARKQSPAIAWRFERTSRRSLSCWRKRIRWFAEGAIRNAVVSAVETKTGEEDVLLARGHPGVAVRKRHEQEEREEHLDAR